MGFKPYIYIYSCLLFLLFEAASSLDFLNLLSKRKVFLINGFLAILPINQVFKPVLD